MNTSASRKRNRSDNFEGNDVQMLLNLVQEHAELIDSAKLELKKQGWEAICSKFNANCIGIKRDINALKLKIKNLKAASKKTKMELRNNNNTASSDPLSDNNNGTINEDDEDFEMENGHFNDSDTKPVMNNSNKIRKRCKKFTKEECDLLLKLHEKYCVGLDSSSTPNSVKKRNDAWDNLTAEFNDLQTNGTTRECNELKIKIKNLKALRVKTEPTEPVEVNNSAMFNDSDTSVAKVLDEKKLITPRPIRSLQNQPTPQKSYEEIAHSTAANDIYYDEEEFEEDFTRPNPKNQQPPTEDKEVEKVRKENLFLKNAVLRKKERLLELQIALAERNLRRQL